MINTLKEIYDLAECIPGYTAVYKVADELERIYYSDDLPSLLGYTKEEYEDAVSTPLSIIFPEDVQNVKEQLVAASKTHGKIDVSLRLSGKSGKTIWVRCHGNCIGDLEGCPIYLTSIYDISDEWESRDIILGASDRGVVVFDRNTKAILYSNEKFFDFSGMPRADCLGKPCYQVICKMGHYDQDRCICFKALGRTEPLITHNPVYDTYYAITGSEIMWGEHPAIIFYLSDVTAETKKDQEICEKNEKLRRIQEEAIRSYQKQLELITDGNSDMLSTCRLNLTKNLCIPGTYRTEFMRKLQTEGTAEGYFRLGRTAMEANESVNKPSLASVAALLKQFDNGAETLSEEGYFHVEAGRTLYVRTTIHMAKNPVTQDVEAIVYTRDLTGIKLRSDIMKRLTEQQYESISIIDLKTRKVSVFSYNYDTVAGSQYDGEDYDVCRSYFVNTFVAEPDRDRYRKCGELENIRRTLDTENTYAFMFHFQPEVGEVRLKTIEYFYTDERHHTIVGATRDITEVTRQQRQQLNELKDALLRADKATEAKSAFFSNISHDMRTPLNGILGFSGLGSEATTLEEAKDYFAKIQSSGEFLLKLINDTLDISKIESGQMKLRSSAVNMDELLHETVNAVEESAHEKGISLRVEYPKPQQTDIMVDKLRLEQLFTNLLGNAIKFTPSGGTVDFIIRAPEVPEQDCNYTITIQDTGIGMKKDFLPHAFEAYAQDDSTPTVKAMGTGLGLAIVKQIVTLMKGEITLTSEEGKGSRFDITLPLTPAQSTEKHNGTKTTESQPVDLDGKRILLCEDHPLNRDLARRLLERKGMTVVCAENGKIGVQLFSESKIGEFDAILMDIRMPEMNGLEATEAIRKLDRADAAKIPIIAMTANAYDSDKKAAFRFGMNAHLAKPINPKELYQTLNDYINATV